MRVEDLLAKLQDVKPTGEGQWVALCPCHADGDPSLSIGIGRDKRILINCFAGCTTQAVVESLDLKLSDLMPSNGRATQAPRPKPKATSKPPRLWRSVEAAAAALAKTQGGTVAGTWLYPGDQFAVVRVDLPSGGKTIRPYHRMVTGWAMGDPDGPLPLYGDLPSNGELLFVTEGEKCVDAARSIGLAAVTSAHGASSPQKSDWQLVAGREVVILPDHDDAGTKYAEAVGRIVTSLDPPARVRIVDLPGLPDGGDIVDWAEGHDGASPADLQKELMALAEAAPTWTPPPGHHAGPPTRRNFPLTQYGLAERFVAQHGQDFRHCRTWGKDLCWNGSHWAIDQTDQTERWMKGTVRSLLTEAAGEEDDQRRKAILGFERKAERAPELRAALDLARSEEGVPILPDDLDKEPFLLNVKNGTLDLQTGELRPHDRADLLTKCIAVEFDPAAKCPRWLQFLQEIMDGDGEMIQFLQRAVGYSLTGDTREQCLFILHGCGANGKSVFIGALESLLGEYAKRTPAETFMAQRSTGIPNDVAALKGARFVAALETEEGHRLAESLVKALTGGDTISARFMRAEWFEFVPTFKLFLASNHRPEIRGTDYAMWRRIRLVPFNVTFAAKRQDYGLPAKLRVELAGVLNWAVQGCLQWQRDGLGMPRAVAVATSEYRTESDAIGRFIDECVYVAPSGDSPRCKAGDLYAAFAQWSKTAGEPPMSATAFGRRLVERGLRKDKRSGAVWYLGVGIRSETDQ